MDLEQFKQRIDKKRRDLDAEIEKAEALEYELLKIDSVEYSLGGHYRFDVSVDNNPGFSAKVRFVHRKSGKSSPVLYDSQWTKNISLAGFTYLAANLRWWSEEIWFGQRYLDAYYFSNHDDEALAEKNCLLFRGQIYTLDLSQLCQKWFDSLEEFLATATDVVLAPVKLPPSIASKFSIAFSKSANIIRLSGQVLPKLRNTELPRLWDKLLNRGHVDLRDYAKAQEVIDKYAAVLALTKQDDFGAKVKAIITDKTTKKARFVIRLNYELRRN